MRSTIEDVIYVRFPEIIIDSLAEGGTISNIVIIAAIICGISLLNNVIPNAFHRYFTKKQETIGLKLRRNIYEKIMQTDYKYVDLPQYYDNYAWAINEYVSQTNVARDFIIRFFQYFSSIAVLTTIIATIGPWILIVEIIQMILHALINLKVNQNDIEKTEQLIPINRRLDYFHRLFYLKEYAADMKSTPLSDYAFEGYDKAGKSKLEVISNFATKTAFWGSMHEVVFYITEFIIVLYLAQSIIAGNIIEIGMYMTMMLAFYRVDSKLYGFIDMLRSANNLSLKTEKIKEFFALKSEIETCKNDYTSSISSQTKFSVQLKNVSFAYEDNTPVLSGINIDIKPGEKIALVGENGSGKTTFTKLLLGMYRPDEGTIYINNNDLSQYDGEDYLRRISIISQHFIQYRMTLRENVAISNISASLDDELVREALRDADFEFDELSYDLDKILGTDFGGVELSGGQWQKVAIARGIFRDSEMIVMDEPTSAIDPITETKVLENFLKIAEGKTAIIISHRTGLCTLVDKIAVMKDEQIVEFGTHETLLMKNGEYAKLFNAQRQWYI